MQFNGADSPLPKAHQTVCENGDDDDGLLEACYRTQRQFGVFAAFYSYTVLFFFSFFLCELDQLIHLCLSHVQSQWVAAEWGGDRHYRCSAGGNTHSANPEPWKRRPGRLVPHLEPSNCFAASPLTYGAVETGR